MIRDKSVEDIYDFEKILGEYDFLRDNFLNTQPYFSRIRGGYATVVLARHLQTGEKYAIKIVDKRRAVEKQDQG